MVGRVDGYSVHQHGPFGNCPGWQAPGRGIVSRNGVLGHAQYLGWPHLGRIPPEPAVPLTDALPVGAVAIRLCGPPKLHKSCEERIGSCCFK